MVLAAAACAQVGDKAGEPQVPIVPANLIPPSPPLTAEEALRSFKVAPGYRIELVAEAPLVRHPTVLQFGPDGRLWVVEMVDYPLGLDGKGKPGGRVRVLEDKDGDGRYESAVLGWPEGWNGAGRKNSFFPFMSGAQVVECWTLD